MDNRRRNTQRQSRLSVQNWIFCKNTFRFGQYLYTMNPQTPERHAMLPKEEIPKPIPYTMHTLKDEQDGTV